MKAGSIQEEGLGWTFRLSRILFGLLLLPLNIVATVTLFQKVGDPEFLGNFWRTSSFFYFLIGFILSLVWLMSGLLRNVFLYLYVFGHEITHVIFVYLSGGKVSGLRISTEGGYVITDRTNFLIALSPYFVPFWSVVIVLLLNTWNFLAGYDVLVELPHKEYILYGLLGATWCFHIVWTLWMIPREQPDLKENDTFFSLMLIYLANMVVLSALIWLGSPNLEWRDFVYYWVNNFMEMFIEPLAA